MTPLSLIMVALAGSGTDAVQSPPAPVCRQLDLPRRLPALAEGWNAVVRQRIGADGVVLDARRWRPATLDGRPVEVWLVKDRADLARP